MSGQVSRGLRRPDRPVASATVPCGQVRSGQVSRQVRSAVRSGQVSRQVRSAVSRGLQRPIDC